ncbi:hypothetical protein MP228_006068 [Amoeboaphelidium protococcarum]|nr:hypothetical protein MP228_006068 [Amoeboaphelidium protococcarum]
MKTASERIGKILGRCSIGAMAYGKCVVAKLDGVEKDALSNSAVRSSSQRGDLIQKWEMRYDKS